MTRTVKGAEGGEGVAERKMIKTVKEGRKTEECSSNV